MDDVGGLIMFKYKGEWYDMNDSNMWSAIVDHYKNRKLYIRGGEFKVLKGDKVKRGEAYVLDPEYDVINLATIDLSWVIEEVMGCEVE